MKPPRPAIVMVDDEQPYVDFLALMLTENLGCDVHTFTRPRAALAALPSIRAAAVVTDYWMPELDGFEFIRLAAEQAPGVPFILISGHPIDPEHSGTRSPALRAVLSKPFGWRVLADEIVRVAPVLASCPLSDPSAR